MAYIISILILILIGLTIYLKRQKKYELVRRILKHYKDGLEAYEAETDQWEAWIILVERNLHKGVCNVVLNEFNLEKTPDWILEITSKWDYSPFWYHTPSS